MCSNHELQATLNALGYLEDDVYYKSRDCLSGTKDLVRYLRRDDPNEKTIRRELLKSDVISNDLIPLLKILKPKKDAELFDIALRLLVNLTQSALNCFEQKIPEDKIKYNLFIEIDGYLKRVKEAFADEQFIKLICERLKEIVGKNWEDRPEEEDLIAERILFLIRNILLIKPSDDDAVNRLETDINSHDLLILSLHKANMFEILNDLAASNNFTKYSTHILEIIVLALQDQSPEELAKVSENEINLKSKRSMTEKEKDSLELVKLQMKDQQVKKHNRMKMNPRHSRFMGTYVAMNVKSINDDNNLIVHKQARNLEDLLEDSSKKIIKKSKNKLLLQAGDDKQHRSVLFIRIILKNFCLGFMKNSYSTFFRNLKDMMQRKKLEDEEICYYYWLVQFLTEFNRNSDLEEQVKIEQIKETFSLELFHSIEVYIQRCIEMMRMEKKDKSQSRLWSKRMHTSLKCYKENLITLYALEKKIAAFNEANNVVPVSQEEHQQHSNNDEEDLVNQAEKLMAGTGSTTSPEKCLPEKRSLLDDRATSLLTKLKNQIFYIQEFRELFITLLKDFDANKMSKGFLRDLIEANHIFILLLEYHTKNTGTLSVMSKKKKKQKKVAKKPKLPKTKETKEEKERRLADDKEFKQRLHDQENSVKEKCWQSQFSKVASLIQNAAELNCVEDNLMPFDFVATSDQEFDSQKEVVIEKIQKYLTSEKPDEAITLFREARYLWPADRHLFGEPHVQADEEFELFKSLYMTKCEIKKPTKPLIEPTANENQDEGIEDDLDNEEKVYDEEMGVQNDEDDEDAQGANNYETQEENLDFEKFLFRYTHPHVLKCFIMMLGEYSKNSDFLNRCCMSMFERIAYECNATPCLYQLSLFNLINTMYKDPLSRCIMDIVDPSSQKTSIDNLYASVYSTEDMFAFFRQLMSKFFEQAKKK